MAKGNILKEAIADAKAVREVALANAKAALEEAFTPKLQNMLNAKLQEDLDEDMYNEDEKDLELGEMMYDEDESMDEMMYDEDETMDEMMYDEDDKMDEEIDLEEILNELELEEGKKADDEETVDEAKDADDDKVDEAKDADDDKKEEQLDEMRPHYKAGNEDGGAMDHRYKAEYVNEGEEFDLDALLKEINDLDEQVPTGTSTRNRPMAPVNKLQQKARAKKNMSYPRSSRNRRMNEGCSDQAIELDVIKKELNETKKAFNSVQNELNEVNLLNSKLLYVNRIFKANTLDDSQKLRVVETLDKADSTKEAKLIYETIKDTFKVANSKKGSSKKQTKTIKESFRGMASKAAGTSRTKKTAPKRAIISESNGMVNRFQKLANIKINE